MPSRLPLLLEADQLAPHLEASHLLLVDLGAPERYVGGHLAGAINLSYAALVRGIPPALGLLPDLAHLSAVCSAIGLTPERPVVAYDDEGGGRASRLLWTLDVLGHPAGSLLNGGLPAWQAAGQPLTTRPGVAIPSRYQAELTHPQALADKDYILARLHQPDLALLDTRSPAEYHGQDQRAARGGHIPGAVNLNWIETMDPTRDLRLKSDAELRARLAALGVTPDKEVIVYCQTHHRSAHTYLVLKHLGYPRVRGYAGAWSEWGNDPALPVAR